MKDFQSEKKKKRLFKRNKQNPSVKKGKVKVIPKKPQEGSKAHQVVNKYENSILLFFIPVALVLIFLIIYTINSHIQKTLQYSKLSQRLNIEVTSIPVIKDPYDPYITAKSAVAIDSDSQTILFSKNPTLRFSTASTAKIMTALVALEYYKPQSELSIKSFRTEGSGLNLQYSDKFYFDDLLYAMLLPSANDAAAAIADNYPGGRSGFVKKMNDKAKNLNLLDTHFVDSIGINDDGNYSTAVDMARLSSIAMKNGYFAQVVSTQQKIIYNINKTHQYIISNLNELLGVNGVNGIKTGTTEGAGEVLVTSAIINGHNFIVVTMNSEDRFADTSRILELITQKVNFVNPLEIK
jgi:D-alanyl-D-alanine carboxypeptidase